MTRHGLIFGLLLAVISAHSSFACQGSSVILDESFKTPESGWDPPDDYTSYGPSGAVLKAPVSGGVTAFNKHFTSDGTDLCATAVWPPSAIKAGKIDASAGILFWAKDYTNYYTATVFSDGTVMIQRLIANTWQTIVSPIDLKEVVHLEPGGVNEVEVQISGSKGILFINGKKAANFVGQPPPGSGYVGLFGASVDTSAAVTLVFPKFQIAAYP